MDLVGRARLPKVARRDLLSGDEFPAGKREYKDVVDALEVAQALNERRTADLQDVYIVYDEEGKLDPSSAVLLESFWR